MSGGMGPTEDDLTSEVVAEVLGVPLEVHAPSVVDRWGEYLVPTPLVDDARQRALVATARHDVRAAGREHAAGRRESDGVRLCLYLELPATSMTATCPVGRRDSPVTALLSQ